MSQNGNGFLLNTFREYMYQISRMFHLCKISISPVLASFFGLWTCSARVWIVHWRWKSWYVQRSECRFGSAAELSLSEATLSVLRTLLCGVVVAYTALWSAYTPNHVLTLWFSIIALAFVSAASQWASSVASRANGAHGMLCRIIGIGKHSQHR